MIAPNFFIGILKRLDDIHKIPHYILHILHSHTGVEREGDLVLEQVICIRIVLDVETESLVGCHHRQRFVMHIGGNAMLCHKLDYLICLFTSVSLQANKIQVE